MENKGIRTRYLNKRYHLMAAVGIAAGGLMLVILLIHMLISNDVPAWMPSYVLLFAVLLIVFCLLFFLYALNPEKKIRKSDDAFCDEAGVNSDYLPEYYWSKESRAVMQRYQTETERKKMMETSIEASRYIALQQQINPHFLYNAMDSIRSDLLIAGEEQIAETVEALSKYFSYVVTNMDKMAGIEEELNNVKDYFHVQEYRFEERVSMEIIDEISDADRADLRMPRLTLQPLVENAIYHGLERIKKHGKVTVHLYESDDDLMIRVSDNGVGMDVETLERLNAGLNPAIRTEKQDPQSERKRRGGIALMNVNSRIKVLFGEDYGLRIYSLPGTGTDVTVRLPKIYRDTLNEERITADF